MIPEIERLPDITFIDGVTLDTIKERLVSDYEEKFHEETGTTVNLKDGEPISLMLYACAVQFMQMYENLDKAGKMNFLKYTYGDFLDNMAAIKGVERQEAAYAYCTVRFTLSAVRSSVISIPKGTRVTTQGSSVYFETDEYAEIPIGDYSVDVLCVCQTKGTAGNGIPAGDIKVLVDPLPYIASVTNLVETTGGTDREDDEALKDRVYLVPANYSVAGPETAYEYWTKTAYSDIGDVRVTSPEACEVDIRVIGKNGQLLSEETCQMIEDYIKNANVIPLTDLVSVSSPGTVSYNVEVTYYINRSDVGAVTVIQDAVNSAIDEYIAWQSERIGRDIEPGKLVELCMGAGAKRVAVTSPTYTVVGSSNIPVLGTVSVTYGGLEDD